LHDWKWYRLNQMNKKLKIIGGFVFVVIIAAIGYVLLTQNINNNAPQQMSNETVEPTEKIVRDTGIGYHLSYIEDIPKNSEIQFKVGQKFIYKTPEKEYGWMTKTFTVEKIERKNGKEYFVVVQESNSTTFDFGEKRNTLHYFTYYYDKENGRVAQIKVNNHTVMDGSQELRATDSSFFAYWMLGLKDNAKWKIKFTEITPSLNLVEHKTFEFRVLGREKVNNRECFKVEKRIINNDKKDAVEDIDLYWVDVEKRIFVKKERYTADKVKYSELNLVSMV